MPEFKKGKLLKDMGGFAIYELIWDEGGEDETIMEYAYDEKGVAFDYWPDLKKRMKETGITEFDTEKQLIGFNPEEEKWYGWTHRGIEGFGLQDSVSEGDVVTLEGVRPGFQVTNMEDAKYLARKYSKALAKFEEYAEFFG